jgi:uncharacterized repeat protein (TIGR01451 family)
MPRAGQDLNANMFQYGYEMDSASFIRLAPWIGNGSTFLHQNPQNIPSAQFAYVNSSAFKIMGPWDTNMVTPHVRKVGTNLANRTDGTTHVGDTIRYTITVTNNGVAGSIWANAVLEDTINQHVEFLSDSVQAPGVWNYSSTTRQFTANLGNIAQGSSVTVIFDVRVSPNAYGQNITNYVTVRGKDGTDPNARDVIETVKEDGDDRYVFSPQVSAVPTISTVTEGDTIIRGTGVSGATIVVRLPNGTDVTTTVATNGTWSVNVPTNVQLAVGNTITARQTEANKTQSQPATTTVQRRTTGGNTGGGGTTVVDPRPPLAGFLLEHVPYIFGYPDNSVRPGHPITRAEAASIFFRLLSAVEKDYPLPSVFSDVRNGVWYSQSVSYLASINIIRGYPDGTFRPDQPITRAEFAAIASRFDNLAETSANAFTDISNHWAVRVINSSFAKGWISGYPDGTFRPEQSITRAEVVTVVNNMLDRRIRIEDIPAGIKVFSDFVGHWAYAAIVEASNDHDYIRGADGFETWRLK